MNKKTIRDIDVMGKKVIVRVDFNVPFDKLGKIEDDTRIVKALPTIKYLLENDAKIILMSHLGRPEGKVVEDLKLEPVSQHLSFLLNEPVIMLNDCVGPEVERSVSEMEDGDIVLLENLRFHRGEKENDPEFAKKLASLADVYVDDAFGTAHRAHASTEGITHNITSVAGFLMEKEIEMLSTVLEKPDHPLVFIIGGAKISTKIKVIKNLIKRVDSMLLGGALVNNILKSQGKNVGKSKVEEDMMEEAKKLIPFLKNNGTKNNLYMPKDCIVAKEASDEAKPRIAMPDDIKEDEMILDIGPETIEFYKEIISKAKMVIWNGPMGMFEITKFASGSYETAKAVAASKGKSIIGGGETLDLVKSLGLEGDVYFVSTGGGAMLKFLEGEELPGIKALLDK